MSEGERKYTGFAAIYQLEQEKLKREKTHLQLEVAAPPAEQQPSPTNLELADEVATFDDQNAATPNTVAPQTTSGDTATAKFPAQRSVKPVTRRRSPTSKPPSSPIKTLALPKSSPASVSKTKYVDPTSVLDLHILKWKQVYRLSKGEINVMKFMFGLTHAQGLSECYIKVPVVAEAAQLKKRRCQYVIRNLETLGLLERLEDFDPSVRLGTKFRVNLKLPSIDER